MSVKERLRQRLVVVVPKPGTEGRVYAVEPLCEEAADEIDRLERERDGLRAALQKAKPIVGAACAAAGATGSNDTRRLREKFYAEICEALRSPEEGK